MGRVAAAVGRFSVGMVAALLARGAAGAAAGGDVAAKPNSLLEVVVGKAAAAPARSAIRAVRMPRPPRSPLPLRAARPPLPRLLWADSTLPSARVGRSGAVGIWFPGGGGGGGIAAAAAAIAARSAVGFTSGSPAAVAAASAASACNTVTAVALVNEQRCGLDRSSSNHQKFWCCF